MLRLALDEEENGGSYLKLHGHSKIKLYSAPLVHRLHPSRGAVTGGTEVLVVGENFNFGFGAISCLFGS